MSTEKQKNNTSLEQDNNGINNISYKEQEWYIKLSPEQKKFIDSTLEKRKDLEKIIVAKQAEMLYKGLSVKIFNSGLQNNRFQFEDAEDISEIQSFEERVDMLNRDIDILSRELYNINLELNSSELIGSFDKSNEYFKKGLLKKDEKNEEIINIFKNKDLSNITAGEIYTLRQEGYDLSKLFLIGAGEFSKDSMKIGDTFKVNFGGNQSLNRNIGAGDLLAIDKIDNVKINGIEGERKLSPRPGYYSKDGKYLAIFDNYKIEIISKKEFTSDENEKSIIAFKERYNEIRKPEILSNLREQLKNSGNNPEIRLSGFSKGDLEIISSYLGKYLPKQIANDLNFDLETGIISSKTGESINDIINKFIDFENLGTGYEKYKDIVIEVSVKYGIRPEKLITLINHENRKWDPMAGAPGSSAYGLGQMIDSTWDIYGKGLDRNNPRDQLEATCKYLVGIMNRQNCEIELAMAYYNTGEGIKNISDLKAQEYANKNPAISKFIIGEVTAKKYFEAAIAYYNNTNIENAREMAYS